MWIFCLRSLFREYGWRFAARVALHHPRRTLKALQEASRLDVSGSIVDIDGAASGPAAGGPPSIVGAGFCLKPVNPPCPSGRATHDCLVLEKSAREHEAGVPVACRACAIREIGTRSLWAGSAFYVMTSARDILDDVYMPTLEDRRFPAGLFVLCRYSFRPFAVGLLASGMSARLVPLGQGDCRDYRTWLLADRGIKDEQTTVDGAGVAGVVSLLGAAAAARAVRFDRRGNVLVPVSARPGA